MSKMHLVVEGMVTEMCDREKERMKAMDQTKLGSWSKAVTCAMVLGRHEASIVRMALSRSATTTLEHCCTSLTCAKKAVTRPSPAHSTREHQSPWKAMVQHN